MSKKKITIAVVGDIHDLWNEYDDRILDFLEVDLVLFVGDFGNESLQIVKQISTLKIPKATICGNHDAWYTATDWGRSRAPYDHDVEDWVQAQLDMLGSTHIGYGYLDFPEWQLSVVGSRPFSWGGPQWRCDRFYQQRYGVANFAESTAKIMDAVSKTAYDNLLFIGHNGPCGLGDRAEDTCGKDWPPIGGDFGDPDFQDAIALSRQQGKTIPLVTFGHMHHSLRHTKTRQRTIINRDSEQTIYLNAAVAPRIENKDELTLHKFSLVSLTDGVIEAMELIAVDEQMKVQSRQNLFSAPVVPPQV